VIDITQPPYNADNTGVQDVTPILNQAITDHTPAGWHIIYFPVGTYRLSNQVRWNSPQGWSFGPVLQGAHRDSVVLKLDDNAPDFQLAAIPKALLYTGDGVAQKFNRGIRDLTVHTGSGNAGAVGIYFTSNNEGIMDRVNVISGDGQGKRGIEMTNFQHGPCLLRDVYVRGFDIGVESMSLNSVTISGLTLEDQNQYGYFCRGFVTTIENLTVRNVPNAVENQGNLTLIGATLEGGTQGLIGLNNIGKMYLRNVDIQGFALPFRSEVGHKNYPRSFPIQEYHTHDVARLYGESPHTSLHLPIKQPPMVPWEQDPAQWANVEAYGAIADDEQDDTPAIQAAIDAGLTTVYFPQGTYHISGDIFIRGKVERLTGCNAYLAGIGTYVLENGPAPAVSYERLYRTQGSQVSVENRSGRSLVVSSALVHRLIGTGTGDMFASSMLGFVDLRHPDQHAYLRHYNSEMHYLVEQNVLNDGATLWILGFKTEHNGTKIKTLGGGTTELIGAHVYPQCQPNDDTLFVVENASFSAVMVREANYCQGDYPYMVKETRGDSVRMLEDQETPFIGTGSGSAWTLYSGYEGPMPDWPIAPNTLLLNRLGGGNVELQWQDQSSDELGFIIEADQGNGFAPFDTVAADVSQASYLLAAGQYRFRVQAYRLAGSDYTNQVSYEATTAVADIPASTFQIAPNPAEAEIWVTRRNGLPVASLSLMDLTGRIYWQQPMPGQRMRVDLEGLAAGLYYLRLGADVKPLLVK
jgi:hypothetical protein